MVVISTEDGPHDSGMLLIGRVQTRLKPRYIRRTMHLKLTW